ncbi:MAG: DNA-3-methyladenine glycosylase, partial [Verrucomicrobia bacterium]|nr:DNA-3-methyladenine glycosylase [Verrucomicrobiota bacterium]
MKLKRSFYTREILTVSRELIGKNLVHHTAEGITKGRIVEVEAYVGAVDKASHAYGNKRTGRT